MDRAAITAVVAFGLLASAWLHGSSHGLIKCEHAAAQAVMAHQRGMIELSEQLEIERRKKEKIVVETVEVIRNVTDPSGCADMPIADGILERLH